ncbi:MAG TPA: DUF5132 domain-containing protein, partial [Pseudonocardiaceae bacterium]|nr:DUF5132 domain-containing protein [Pseudonocardiaceae bacterium]
MPVVAPYLIGVVTAPLVVKIIKPIVRGTVKASVGLALEVKKAAAEAGEEFQDIAAEVSSDKAAEAVMSADVAAQTSEAAPRTAKSVGTPNSPCGFLSASSRGDSRSGAADRRHPLRRIGRPKPKSPSLCRPSWLVRRSKRLCGSGRGERYALPGTWLKCQSSRDQGSLRPVRDCARKGWPLTGQ